MSRRRNSSEVQEGFEAAVDALNSILRALPDHRENEAACILIEWVEDAYRSIEALRATSKERYEALRFYESILAYTQREAARIERGEQLSTAEWDRRQSVRELYAPRPIEGTPA